MKSFVIYTVLFAFNVLSITPSGIGFSSIRASDDLELDELDLGLDNEEDAPAKTEKKTVDEDEEENEKVETDSFEDTSESTDESSPAVSDGRKKIAAFFLYQDSFAEKSARHISAETAYHLSISNDYNYLQTEAEFFIPSMSVAKKDLENGIETFNEAKSLYNDLSIEEAIIKFQSAKKTIEKHIDKIPDMKVLGDILLYLGASYKMLDEDEKSTPYFSSYLSINPDAELDDVVFSPEIVSFFNKIKEDFMMLPNGSVAFESYPQGAMVIVDGKISGVTPVTINGVTEGRHYYRIHKNGYRDRAGSVSVRERKEAKLSEDLTKYENTGFIDESETAMLKDFGHLAMLRKAVELGGKLKVDSVLVTNAVVEGENVTYSGYLVNVEKKNFKKAEASFAIPEEGDAGASDELQNFNKELIDDSLGFKPVSDVALDEAELLGLDNKKSSDKEKTPVYKQWWLWTLLGVVVLGGAGVGIYFGVKGADEGQSGATLEVNF
ncbi:MAG TPA: PEGA domain-containing protein [bacterium]|nr:PEGA domain-containing protein [bacterium]HPS28650.1 PEGA domain-containing protein [bacterium]